jgi:hypothetical protein
LCHIITHVPADMADLKQKAQGYTNAGGECGGIMLHYADENFTFREGANRFYVYFTDEPNQPGGNAPWSVLTVNKDSGDYNWDSSKGVVYTPPKLTRKRLSVQTKTPKRSNQNVVY